MPTNTARNSSRSKAPASCLRRPPATSRCGCRSRTLSGSPTSRSVPHASTASQSEVKLAPDQILRIREFMHPRLQEIAETLPGRYGRMLLGSKILSGHRRRLHPARPDHRDHFDHRLLHPLVRRQHAPLAPHVAALSVGTRRHRILAARASSICSRATHPALALEVALTQNLVKGYSDTYTRGRGNFDALMALRPHPSEPPRTDPRFSPRLRAKQPSPMTAARRSRRCARMRAWL